MSKTYRKTPSASEASGRKKLCKRIANREVRRAIKNGVEMANGSEYKYHVKDRWDYVDYCMSYRADSLASWLDMEYEYYVYEINSYYEHVLRIEEAEKMDLSDATLEYYESMCEKFDYDYAYDDWSANSSILKEKYGNVETYLIKRRSELERAVRRIKYNRRLLVSEPVYPVWDRSEREQEYKKRYLYK